MTFVFQHEFITQAKPCTILHKMIQEAKEIHEAQSQANQNEEDSVSTRALYQVHVHSTSTRALALTGV